MNPNPFHVTVTLLWNGLYRHEFYYGTDQRDSRDLPCVDAVAIHQWCHAGDA